MDETNRTLLRCDGRGAMRRRRAGTRRIGAAVAVVEAACLMARQEREFAQKGTFAMSACLIGARAGLGRGTAAGWKTNDER